MQPNGSSKIEFKNLSFSYGGPWVLQSICLLIKTHQVTALIGPSGCGKSTLIKSINRIAEVTEPVRTQGDVLLDGESVYAWGVDLVGLRRRVGMVFQKPNPFPKSIYDNVAFGPRLMNIQKAGDLDGIVERSLKSAALWEEVKDRLHHSAWQLSGGQQQRLCIARAIAVDPEVILMDEPCSALDPTATARIEELMLDLKRNYTIVIVTHNMQQAARVSDETGFLLGGSLIEFAPTNQLFTNPSNPKTEAYITGRFG